VQEATKLGFEIRLLYVILPTVEMNIERVRQRVAAGGHDVAETKIRERRERSLQQLPWFLQHADLALIFDNSASKPKLVGRKEQGEIVLDPAAPETIRTAVETLKT
jgi:predicted ABC-type ATPase